MKVVIWIFRRSAGGGTAKTNDERMFCLWALDLEISYNIRTDVRNEPRDFDACLLVAKVRV